MRKAVLIISAVVVLSLGAIHVFRSRGRRVEEMLSPEEAAAPVEQVERVVERARDVETPAAREVLPPACREAVDRLKDDSLRLAASRRLLEEWIRTGDGDLFAALDAEVVPLLVEDYGSTADVQRRGEIIDILASIGSDSAVAFLSEIAESGDTVSSPRAVAELERLSEGREARAVAEFIGGRGQEIARWKAAREASKQGGEMLVEPLLTVFQEGEPRARIMAIYAMKGIYDRTGDERLGEVLGGEALASLSEMALTYLDLQIKRDSWETLGYVDPLRALEIYRRQEELPDAVDERAVLSIGGNGDEAAAAAAVALFDDAGSDRKMVSACRIVGLIGARRPGGPAETFMRERGLPFLEKVAADGGMDRRLRKRAIAALGESGDEESLPLLRELVAEYPREASRAISAIGRK